MKDKTYLDYFADVDTVSLDPSDIWRIRRKMIKSSIFFMILLCFPICLFLYTIANKEVIHTLLSMDGIVYHLFGWVLPGFLLIINYGKISDGRKFLKQGVKLIRRVKIINKEDKVYYGRNNTKHNYTIESDSGPVTLEDTYFGKSSDEVFEQLYVGSVVDLIYSQDGKSLLDIRVDDSHFKVTGSVKGSNANSHLYELKYVDTLSTEDKNTLFTVYRRHIIEHVIQIGMLSLLAFPVTIVSISNNMGSAGFFLILIFDGALFFYLFMISRKYLFDWIRNRKELYVTFVKDKIHRKRHGVIFNNTPFTNQDSDFFIINTPLMEFYVPEELYNKLQPGEIIFIEMCPSSKTLLSVSKP